MGKNKNIKRTPVTIEKKNNDEVNKNEPMSKKEKMFTWIISAIAATVIIVIVLVNVFSGNKEDDFSKYTNLEKDNIYEVIKYDEIIKKLDNKEEFYLIVANDNYKNDNTNCEDAIISINKVAKDQELAFNVNKIYYISLNNLTIEQKYELYYNRCGNLTKYIFDVPCLIYFAKENSTYTAKEVSSLYNVETYLPDSEVYSDKWDALYEQYFKNCK